MAAADSEERAEDPANSSLLDHPYAPGSAFLVFGGVAAAFGFSYGVRRAKELASTDEAKAAQAEGAAAQSGTRTQAASQPSRIASTVTPATTTTSGGRARQVRPRAAPAVEPTRVALRALLAGTALCAVGAGAVVLGAGYAMGVGSLQEFSDKMKRDVPGVHRRVCDRLGIALPEPPPPMTRKEESQYLDRILSGASDGDEGSGGRGEVR